MSLLVLTRHGRSVWNEEDRFAGWVDVPLALSGENEARAMQEKLRDVPFSAAFTSKLCRAQMTLRLVLEGRLQHPAVFEDSALNERHYGDLQGMYRAAARERYGAEQIRIWRRSLSTAPPGGESLSDTAARVLPYFTQKIIPVLASGGNVLVVAHGNSLRSIIMHIEGLTPSEIEHLEVATGTPLFFWYVESRFERIDRVP